MNTERGRQKQADSDLQIHKDIEAEIKKGMYRETEQRKQDEARYSDSEAIAIWMSGFLTGAEAVKEEEGSSGSYDASKKKGALTSSNGRSLTEAL